MEIKIIFVLLMLLNASVAVNYIKKKKSNGRIIGGEEVPVKYPYAVSIVSLPITSIFPLCAASIIRKYWALTAAACLDNITTVGMDLGLVVVRGNTTLIDCRTLLCVDHRITRYFIHKYFLMGPPPENDIALLKVLEPFDGLQEKRVLLPPRNYPYKTGTLVIAVGWGEVTTGNNVYSTTLRYSRLRIFNYEKCKSFYTAAKESPFPKKAVCAYSEKTDPCIGDTGGPLLQKRNILLGITSFGLECVRDHMPSIYTKVSKYFNWINETISSFNTEDHFLD